MVLDRDIPDADVCLALMPYLPVVQPSSGVSILKAALQRAEIATTVVYANLQWAEEIDLYLYDPIQNMRTSGLIGEWTFGRAAFPDHEPDPCQYFADIQLAVKELAHRLHRMGHPENDVPTMLRRLRRQAMRFIDGVARAVLQTQPRIVGCSSMFQQHCASLGLLRRIKELAPDTVTMLGGTNCDSSMGVVTHKMCPWIDFVVSGEADTLLPELCQQIFANGVDISWSQLPQGVLGPAHRRANGLGHSMLEQRPPRATLANINDSPIPDYDDYFSALRRSSIGYLIRPVLPIETSRGCWWGEISHCTFCGLNGGSMTYRSKHPGRVVEEFDHLAQKYHIKNFLSVDAILDMSYFDTVLPVLASREQKYNIMYEIKSNLSRRHLKLLAGAGVRWVQPGIESLNDEILKLIGKGVKARQNIQLLKWAQELGIFVSWNFIHTVPGESDDWYLKMAEWLPKISHLQPPNTSYYIEYHRFSPYQMKPEEFGLDLTPCHAYRHVYPWSGNDLSNFAYVFDDYTRDRNRLDCLRSVAAAKRPGLRALEEINRNWQEEWIRRLYPELDGPEPATLLMDDDGEQLTITDTRRCALRSRHRLTGATRQLYQICDKARKPRAIIKAFKADYGVDCAWQDIAGPLRDLCGQGLMLELSGHFLSLAMRSPLRRILDPTLYATGGIVDIKTANILRLYQRARRAQQAGRQTTSSGQERVAMTSLVFASPGQQRE